MSRLDIQYHLADIILIRGKSWFAKLILKAGMNTVSHCGIVISERPIIITEAIAKVKTHPIWHMVTTTEKMYIVHHRHLTYDERVAIVDRACGFSALPYGVGKIMLQGLDVIFRTDFFSLNFSHTRYPYCSYFPALAYAERGITFGESYKTVRPDEILAWTLAHDATYQVTEIDLV